MKYNIKLLKNYLRKMLGSPLRVALTLSGLVLSVVILMTGLIFSRTYIESKKSKISVYKKNGASVIEGNVDYSEYEKIKNAVETSRIELASRAMHTVKKIEQGSRTITVNISDVRVNGLDLNFLPEYDSEQRYESKIIYGRTITEEDVEEEANVAVISSMLARLLYDTEDAVGEYISFPVYRYNEENGQAEIAYYERIKVVGIYEACDTEQDDVKEALNSDKDEAIRTYIYTPLSLNIADKGNDDYKMSVIVYSDENRYAEQSIQLEQMCLNDLEDEYTLLSYYSLLENIELEMKSVKRVITYMVGFMFIISAVLIINTMTFSVKERINEIGIRKAIGAFDTDILSQFIFEGIAYGVLGSVAGVLISLIMSADIFLILKKDIFMGANLIITPKDIGISMLISITIGAIASIIPAIYASKIKITDAIKYD